MCSNSIWINSCFLLCGFYQMDTQLYPFVSVCIHCRFSPKFCWFNLILWMCNILTWFESQNNLKGIFREVLEFFTFPYYEWIWAFKNTNIFMVSILTANQFHWVLFYSFCFFLKIFRIFPIFFVKLGCFNFLSLLGSILVNCTFLENCPFHLSFHIYFHRVVPSSLTMKKNPFFGNVYYLLSILFCIHVLIRLFLIIKIFSILLKFSKGQKLDL